MRENRKYTNNAIENSRCRWRMIYLSVRGKDAYVPHISYRRTLLRISNPFNQKFKHWECSKPFLALRITSIWSRQSWNDNTSICSVGFCATRGQHCNIVDDVTDVLFGFKENSPNTNVMNSKSFTICQFLSYIPREISWRPVHLPMSMA